MATSVNCKTIGPACLILLGVVQAARAAGPTYLDRVTRFADTMLRHGTDRYGPVRAPLLANALTRDAVPELVPDSPKLKDWPPRFTAVPNVFIGGDYAHKVSIAGADVGADRRLYATLYLLSDLTGRPQYAGAADASLKWFLDHTPHSATGLLPWGEHTGWDFRRETFETGPRVWPDPQYQNKHEFAEHWELWDKFAALPDRGTAVLEAYAAAIYRGHVYFDNDRLRYSRHGDLIRPDNKLARLDGGMYPRHGGYFVEAMAAAYEYTDKPAVRADMAAKIGTFAAEWETLLAEHGYVPFDLTHQDTSRAPNDSLAVSLRRAAARLKDAEPALTKRLHAIADRAFPKRSAATAAAAFMTGDLPERSRGKTAKHQTRPGYTAGWNLPGRVPMQYADAILTLLEAADAREADAPFTRAQYLDRAAWLADRAIDLFLEDGTGSPLPRMLDKHSPIVLPDGQTTALAFYHSYTGGDDLMYALLRLHGARRAP